MCTTVAAIELVDQLARAGSCHFASSDLFISLSMGAWRIGEASYLMSTHVEGKYQSDMTWDAANATDGSLTIQLGTG